MMTVQRQCLIIKLQIFTYLYAFYLKEDAVRPDKRIDLNKKKTSLFEFNNLTKNRYAEISQTHIFNAF